MKIDVLNSGLWQLSSVILSDAGETLVVDPAYFPRELEEVGRRSAERGQARGVVFTHGHWDHVAGWTTFPEAQVWGSVSLANAVARGDDVARANLAEVHDFDGRWYVDRRIAWPASVRPAGEGQTLAVGREQVRALLLPGHSADGLGLVTGGTLLCGDYLSPLEIPFVDDLHDYRATLKRMLGMLAGEIAEVIPGHGPRLPAAQASEIARADLVYLDALERCAERRDDAGAAAIVFPRAGAVPGMRDEHFKSWKKCLQARQVATDVAG